MSDPELALRQPSLDANYSIAFNVNAPAAKIAFALGATAGGGVELAAYFTSDWPPVLRDSSVVSHGSHAAPSLEAQSIA